MTETSERTFRKVSAFVTRNSSRGCELLTFLHPLAGRQIPAGSVEVGEEPAAAAVREVSEETGLYGLFEAVRLGVEIEPLVGAGIMMETCRPLPASSDATVETTILPIRRGYRVAIHDHRNGNVEVEHRTFDFNVDPPRVLDAIRGIVPANKVALTVERHFFWMAAPPSEKASWSIPADGHVFEIQWVPMNPRPDLVKSQRSWLERYEAAILRNAI